MNKPKDASHALLFLGKLSRDNLNYMQSKQQSSIDWSSLKNMETAFFKKYPDHRQSYDAFMISESKQWQKLFGSQFKLHSFSEFVFTHREDFDFIY